MADNTTWPEVTDFADGDNVDAATLNRPIQQLAARTEHLLRLLSNNDHTKIAVTQATVSNPDGYGMPKVGQPVYRCADGTYAMAIGEVGENEWFYASQRAMAVGVVGSISGSAATIVLNGYLSLGSGVAVGTLIEDSAPASGRYYLSNVKQGKFTASPSGPVIYMCDLQIANGRVMSMLVNPQYRDTGESHIHRSFVIGSLPLGKYAVKVGGVYSTVGLLPDGAAPSSSGSYPPKLMLYLYGSWSGGEATYTFVLGLAAGASSGSTNWSDYVVSYTSDDPDDAAGQISLSALAGATTTARTKVGSHGLEVIIQRRSSVTSPVPPAGDTWTVAMPSAAQAWLKVTGGYRLNLAMYPEMARFVPPLPLNGASLVVDGVELRGPVFGTSKQWDMLPADWGGGPWLMWYGDAVDADSVTTPFKWTANNEPATARSIVFHLNRMRVGPTGFVTSLQPAPGSPFKITSAQTDANAVQGALQIGMDIDFTSEDAGVEGFQVIKRIEGTRFKTGPVVERILAGPGVSLNRQQGVVTISTSNAVYAGDFETIALKNAKQDLAGGVFPYTKLLGWGSGTNTDSGFTAKFRVPDHIPNKKYYVVVSASVFGEAATSVSVESVASFNMSNYVLGDQACSEDAPADNTLSGSIASPAEGLETTINVPFRENYGAFDPVLLHGFGSDAEQTRPGTMVIPDGTQRRSIGDLWLKDGDGNPVEVYPGYFVGLAIQRCATSGSATPYTAPIGFLSLRWNLVEVPEVSGQS